MVSLSGGKQASRSTRSTSKSSIRLTSARRRKYSPGEIPSAARSMSEEGPKPRRCLSEKASDPKRYTLLAFPFSTRNFAAAKATWRALSALFLSSSSSARILLSQAQRYRAISGTFTGSIISQPDAPGFLSPGALKHVQGAEHRLRDETIWDSSPLCIFRITSPWSGWSLRRGTSLPLRPSQ